jgi:TPR repeat protein
MMSYGREGVVMNEDAALELAEKGVRLGCHHCQGVMADSGWLSHNPQSLELARISSELGSPYGQYALGKLYHLGRAGVVQNYAQAVALFRLAAAQNLDEAQFTLGYMSYYGNGVAQDYAEALRLFQLAAAQGHPEALYYVAKCHECGFGVTGNQAEGISWYRRAQAAGYYRASYDLRRLRA